jgi:hypothetical protein
MLNSANAARKSDEPPVAHPGAVPDSDRDKRPPLPEVPYKPYVKPEVSEALYEPYKKKPGPEAAYKPYAEKPAESEAPYEPYKGMQKRESSGTDFAAIRTPTWRFDRATQ